MLIVKLSLLVGAYRVEEATMVRTIPIPLYDNGRANKVYVCRINPNQEPILHEGLAMKWMSIEEVEALELGFNQKGTAPVLKLALRAVF